ncbi:hypothetical protein QBC43DRAFT_320835 [Cladorrhinum sp. PSN259]|nr:hypothetical protein QBC43DRAFT_320835 [Cladorrhinum sp. PSN259]
MSCCVQVLVPGLMQCTVISSISDSFSCVPTSNTRSNLGSPKVPIPLSASANGSRSLGIHHYDWTARRSWKLKPTPVRYNAANAAQTGIYLAALVLCLTTFSISPVPSNARPNAGCISALTQSQLWLVCVVCIGAVFESAVVTPMPAMREWGGERILVEQNFQRSDSTVIQWVGSGFPHFSNRWSWPKHHKFGFVAAEGY